MNGAGYGADAHIDMASNETVAISTKEKIKMGARETDKSVSMKDHKPFELIKQFVDKAGLLIFLKVIVNTLFLK